MCVFLLWIRLVNFHYQATQNTKIFAEINYKAWPSWYDYEDDACLLFELEVLAAKITARHSYSLAPSLMVLCGKVWYHTHTPLMGWCGMIWYGIILAGAPSFSKNPHGARTFMEDLMWRDKNRQRLNQTDIECRWWYSRSNLWIWRTKPPQTHNTMIFKEGLYIGDARKQKQCL